MRAGGFSDVKLATADVQQLVEQVKAQAETQVGHALPHLTAVSFISQVVAGAKYIIKAKVGATSEHIHLSVWSKPWESFVQLNAVAQDKTETDPLENF